MYPFTHPQHARAILANLLSILKYISFILAKIARQYFSIFLEREWIHSTIHSPYGVPKQFLFTFIGS